MPANPRFASALIGTPNLSQSRIGILFDTKRPALWRNDASVTARAINGSEKPSTTKASSAAMPALSNGLSNFDEGNL